MTDQDPRDVDLADPRREDFGKMMQGNMEVLPPNMQQQLSPRQVGDLFGTLTTAQPVIKDRNIPALMQTLKALAQAFGDSYIYSWDVNDKNSKRPDKKTTIEGPTIQLANDLAREFGNCGLDIRLTDEGTHWTFYGRFIDLQTGYTLTRPFRQRKNAMAGKYEDDRKLDMSFQAGASKCLRNVTVNALRNYVEFMMEEARRAVTDKIKKDPDFYQQAINRGLEKFGVAQQSAETMIGRKRDEWTVRDIAKVFGVLKAIAEGLVDVSEAFPKDGPQTPEPENNTETTASNGDGAAEAEGESGGKDSGKSPRASDSPEPAKETTEKKAAAKAEPAKTEAATTGKKTAAPKPKALF